MRDSDACAIRYLGEKASDRALHALVGAIGSDGFAGSLLAALSEHCLVDFCMAYAFDGRELRTTLTASPHRPAILSRQAELYTVGGLWRHDANLNTVLKWTGAPRLAHVDLWALGNTDLHDRLYRMHGVVDRIIVSDGKVEPNVISLLRTSATGPFSQTDVQALENIGGIILSIIASHRQLIRASAARTLSSLENIQARITTAGSRLSEREIQVCARILWGLTSAGIAMDLGISVETAITYRKRAYHRLDISSQRELLLWYLKQATSRAEITPNRAPNAALTAYA